MGNVTTGFAARARADAYQTWNMLTRAAGRGIFLYSEMMNNRASVSEMTQYTTMAVGSSVFIFLQMLWAIQVTASVPIWVHSLINALVWTLVGGFAWLLMCSGRFVSDITGNALRAANAAERIVTGGAQDDPYRRRDHKSTLLANTRASDRRIVYAYDAWITLLFVWGALAQWMWWHSYRSLGNIAHITNANVLMEYRTMELLLGGTLVVTVPLTAAMLMAFNRTFISIMFTAIASMLGRRNDMKASVGVNIVADDLNAPLVG